MASLYKFLFLFFVVTSSGFKGSSQGTTIDTTQLTDGTEMELETTIYSITPPEGYMYLSEYKSFINRTKETSISVTTHDTISYYVMISSMLHSDNIAPNVSLVSKEELAQGKGFVFTYLFEVQGVEVERMVYLKGDAESCVVVNANYKRTDKSLYLPELRAAAFSITK